MKKIKRGILFTALLILILLLMNKFHFLYNTACGSGIAGLRLLTIYTGIFIIILIVLQIKKKTNRKKQCKSCKVDVQADWIICSYCGMELEGRAPKQ